MKIKTYDNQDDWLNDRLGRITGSKLGDLIGKRDGKPKKGYYELIAERVAIPSNGENAMDRGHRLEDEALQRFAAETKKKVKTDLVMWFRDDNLDIAISPDGFIEKKVKGKVQVVEACEVKCLNSANHIEAYLTQKIPKDYDEQVIQYFIVNDDLKKLYFLFYDPRMPKDFFWLTFTREQLQDDIDSYLTLERRVLEEVEAIEKMLTFE